MLPSFLIIGAMKAGTTSLYDALAQSPEVFPALQKEPQYFSLNYSKGVEWYKRQFFDIEGCEGKYISGDASPYYMYHPLVPQRIYDTLPNVKLIALLRDPVSRAYSQYQHFLKYDTTTRSFEQELEFERETWEESHQRVLNGGINDHQDRAHAKWSYLARSRYAEQLDRYYKLFPKGQILVIYSKDLYSSPDSWMEIICNHIGIKPFKCNFPHSNGNQYPKMSNEIREELEEYFDVYSRCTETDTPPYHQAHDLRGACR